MGDPIPVLFAHHGLNWITGSERCLLDLVKHLDRDRFQPVVVCNTPAVAAEAETLGAAVYCGSQYEAPDGLLPDRALAREARSIIQRHRIRVVHANDFQPFKWLLPAARNARIPIVLHVHLPSNVDERCYSWTHQATRIVGVSRAAVKGFLDDGVAPDRTTIIYNAVDAERISQGDATALRQELGIAADETVIVAVGSLIARKGIDLLLRAVSIVNNRAIVSVRVLIVGDGPERVALESLTTALGLSGVVHFLGRRPDPGAILRDAGNIAVSGAREEAFPLNILEAGFFGLPIVATDIPPHREAVEHARTGLLAPVDDPGSFAFAIERIAGDSNLAARLGEAARERVRAHFMIADYVRQFADLYEMLAAARDTRYGWMNGSTWPHAYTHWVTRRLRARLFR